MEGMKRTHRIQRILILGWITLLVATVALCAGCNHTTTAYAVPANVVAAADADDGWATVVVPEGRAARVLVLTDLGLDPSRKYSVVGCDNDKTLALLTAMVRAAQPDLVVLAGNLTDTAHLNNWRYMALIADTLRQTEVPWTFAFGAADSPAAYVAETTDTDAILGHMTKANLLAALHRYDGYCLAAMGTSADGSANHVVQVRNSAGKLLHSVVCMDSIGDVVGPDQTQWYTVTLAAIAAAEGHIVPSTVVRHDPIGEVYSAYRMAAETDDARAALLEGTLPMLPAEVPADSTSFWAAVRQMGSTQGFFCGRDIDNDAQLTLDGIHLGYVPHSGLSCPYRVGIDRDFSLLFWPADTHFDFGRLNALGDRRGGMLVHIAEDGETTYRVLRAAEVTDYATLGIDYTAVKEELVRKRGQKYVID